MRRALAEGAALTVAATLATAPLMALHFGTVSVVSLPANLLALLAVAPVMWLGMLAAAVGQLPWLPVEPLTWLAGLLAAYIAQVAALVRGAALGAGRARRRRRRRRSRRVYAALARWLGAGAAPGRAGARGLRPGAPRGSPAGAVAGAGRARRARPLGAAPARRRARRGRAPGLTATVLDVGQGDAILLEPAGGDPVLVDAGPPDADVAGELDERGIDRLAALVLTHPDSRPRRRRGGVLALDRGRPPRSSRGRRRPCSARRGPPAPRSSALARAPRCAPGGLRLGCSGRRARLAAEAGPPRRAEPALARPAGPLARLPHAAHRRRRGGARRRSTRASRRAQGRPPRQRGRRASAALLAEAEPELAVISVGADNPYGHPTPATLADPRAGAGAGRCAPTSTARSTIDVGGGGWSVGDG